MTRPRSRVLLVEDHQDTRNMYAMYLSDQFEIDVAADGDQALRAMEHAPPDLVVTDLALPGMSGAELIARMRDDPRFSHVPVICLSGFGHDQVALATAAGATRILQKPCLPDALAEAVLQLV